VSRSFGKKVTELTHAKEALASYVATAAEKLRTQQSLTSHITVYAVTNRYHDPQNYFQSTRMQFAAATDYTPDLIAAAHTCLETIFKKGLVYKKVGVLFDQLIPNNFLQLSTIKPISNNILKQTKSMHTIDSINSKWGRNTLFFAASGIEQPWKMYQARKSACFTTNWHELLTIQL
jgi:DNA polymerase V